MSAERRTSAREMLAEVIAARLRNDADTVVRVGTEILEAIEPTDVRYYGHAHRELGAVYLVTLEDYPKAEHHFRCAVAARPTCQWMSVGLFNALVRQGLWIAGMREILRLVMLADSSKYRDLLSDEFIRGLRETGDFWRDVQRMAQEAQQILAERN